MKHMAYFKEWDTILTKNCWRILPPGTSLQSRLLTLRDSQCPSNELLMSMPTSTSLTYKNYNTTNQSMSFPANFSPITLVIKHVRLVASLNCSGMGQNFPKPKKLLRIKLAKSFKKLRRLRDSKTTRRSLNTPALIFN